MTYYWGAQLSYLPQFYEQNEVTYTNVRVLYLSNSHLFLFVFVALRPMSTAMVIAGRSVHLTTLFPGQA